MFSAARMSLGPMELLIIALIGLVILMPIAIVLLVVFIIKRRK